LLLVTAAAPAVLLVVSVPWAWTVLAARGHIHDEADAPTADVAIVLGTEVTVDGRPSPQRGGWASRHRSGSSAGQGRTATVWR
jgi:hypothetical protein